MKKITPVITSVILLVAPLSAAAATTLHIQQTVTSAHTGGLLNEDFGSINISYSGHTNWAHVNMVGSGTTDVPLDDFGTYPVDYSVAVGSDPRGIFVVTLGSDCSGTVQKDESKTCTITWLDTGPNATQPQTTTVAPSTPAPVQQVPAPVSVSIPLSQPTQAASQAVSTTTDTSSPDEATQIAALRAEIVSLLKILAALLQAKIAAMNG